MLRLAICSAKRSGRKIDICGQTPSDHPDFSAFLAREGINSISPNPDAVINVRLAMAELEKQLS
jgi:pyruvate,water dikinase